MIAIFRHLRQEWCDFCRFTYPLTSTVLLIISLCMMVEILLFGLSPASAELLQIGGADYNSFYNPMDWWQLVTSNFLHSNLLHFASVACGLWYMSSRLERRVGAGWLLAVILAGSVGSSIASILFTHPALVQVGASGIVAAACGAGLVVDWRARLRLGKTARWFLVSFGLYALIAQDHSTAAHVGGITSGLIIGAVYYYVGCLQQTLNKT